MLLCRQFELRGLARSATLAPRRFGSALRREQRLQRTHGDERPPADVHGLEPAVLYQAKDGCVAESADLSGRVNGDS